MRMVSDAIGERGEGKGEAVIDLDGGTIKCLSYK